MKTSALFTLALVTVSQVAGVSAGANPLTAGRRVPNEARKELGVQRPVTFPLPNVPTSQGCFSSSGNLTMVGTPNNFSSGKCEEVCKPKQSKVMALQGNKCYCGSVYPPKNTVVKDGNCNFPCPSYPEEACGGLGDPGYWSVFNTGVDVNAQYMPNEDDKDKTSSSSTSSTSTTVAPTTSVSTAPTTSETQEQSEGGNGEKSSGPNTAGIAAGVVVGVAVIAGGIGGFFFWMRRRRNAEIEEDHRRNAAVNAFINGSKPPSSHGSISMTDSRLDPVMAHRRMSDGSIADNEDYSRRILRVTNA